MLDDGYWMLDKKWMLDVVRTLTHCRINELMEFVFLIFGICF